MRIRKQYRSVYKIGRTFVFSIPFEAANAMGIEKGDIIKVDVKDRMLIATFAERVAST